MTFEEWCKEHGVTTAEMAEAQEEYERSLDPREWEPDDENDPGVPKPPNPGWGG